MLINSCITNKSYPRDSVTVIIYEYEGVFFLLPHCFWENMLSIGKHTLLIIPDDTSKSHQRCSYSSRRKQLGIQAFSESSICPCLYTFSKNFNTWLKAFFLMLVDSLDQPQVQLRWGECVGEDQMLLWPKGGGWTERRKKFRVQNAVKIRNMLQVL